MSKLIYKAAYSRPIQFKRHLLNQHKLNEFLGRNLLDDKVEDFSDEFSIAEASMINKRVASNNHVTYAELLERIGTAEKNYNSARQNQLASGTDGASKMANAFSQ